MPSARGGCPQGRPGAPHHAAPRDHSVFPAGHLRQRRLRAGAGVRPFRQQRRQRAAFGGHHAFGCAGQNGHQFGNTRRGRLYLRPAQAQHAGGYEAPHLPAAGGGHQGLCVLAIPARASGAGIARMGADRSARGRHPVAAGCRAACRCRAAACRCHSAGTAAGPCGRAEQPEGPDI